jgi:hypothetical protein
MWTDPENIKIAHRHMNFENGTEAEKFLCCEYINGILVAVWFVKKEGKKGGGGKEACLAPAELDPTLNDCERKGVRPCAKPAPRPDPRPPSPAKGSSVSMPSMPSLKNACT